MELQDFMKSRKDRMSDACRPKDLKSVYVNVKREIRAVGGLTTQEKQDSLAAIDRHFYSCMVLIK